MTEVLNNHSINGWSVYSHQNNHHTDIADVNILLLMIRTVIYASWNINGLGNKMTDSDLVNVAFIRNYDIIFL